MVNKKIILSVLIIGCIATVAGAGTWAYFDDTKQVSNNQIKTGTIKLTNQGNAFESFSIPDAAPGDSKDIKTVRIKNDGTLKGHLYADITTSGDIPAHLKAKLDGRDMTNGASIDLGPLNSQAVKEFKITYEFNNEQNANQNGEQDKTATYNINYRLKQEI